MEVSPQSNTFTDERIFHLEYLESLNNQPNENDQSYPEFMNYKLVKKRYVFEVTNWF